MNEEMFTKEFLKFLEDNHKGFFPRKIIKVAKSPFKAHKSWGENPPPVWCFYFDEEEFMSLSDKQVKKLYNEFINRG